MREPTTFHGHRTARFSSRICAFRMVGEDCWSCSERWSQPITWRRGTTRRNPILDFTGTAERAHRAGAEQSVGVRGTVRQDKHRVSGGVRCTGERLPRQYSRRVLRQQPTRRPHGYGFRSRNVSGRRRPAIRGMNRPARRCRSELPSGPPARRVRRWPGPALRPKRFALRATQGYAPGQANRTEKQGSRRSTEKRIVVPGAC